MTVKFEDKLVVIVREAAPGDPGFIPASVRASDPTWDKTDPMKEQVLIRFIDPPKDKDAKDVKVDKEHRGERVVLRMQLATS